MVSSDLGSVRKIELDCRSTVLLVYCSCFYQERRKWEEVKRESLRLSQLPGQFLPFSTSQFPSEHQKTFLFHTVSLIYWIALAGALGERNNITAHMSPPQPGDKTTEVRIKFILTDPGTRVLWLTSLLEMEPAS